ncbi:hypothetical protein [Streptomyces sp. NPDC001139]
MGYKRNPKIYKLVFGEDTDYAGLEVQVRGMSTGQIIAAKTGKAVDGRTSEEAMMELLADRIVSWNLEDEKGNPVPPTLEAFLEEDEDLMGAIINHWTQALAGVPDPLPDSSLSGEPSLVESIPTEALSPSLAS